MKHTSKRLLSILLCLVLMLSLVPAAYADDPTTADCEDLMSDMKNLIAKMKAENKVLGPKRAPSSGVLRKELRS